MLRARKHDLTTETVTKIALSASDDKRFLLRSKKHETLAWGHYAIPHLKK